MKSRAGFTLLELLIAIVLSGVVALLVYGAAAVGTDTQERLVTARRNVAGRNAFRAIIVDALRNSRAASFQSETVMQLEDRVGPDGTPTDRLSFVTAGGGPPLTTDTEWAVTMELTGSGLQLAATPVGVAAPHTVALNLPEVSRFDVQLLTPGEFREWVTDWGRYDPLPRAARLTLGTTDGTADEVILVYMPSGVGR
jgi:prepilin-type N-terminal cleavage/methylation domain-containing protein